MLAREDAGGTQLDPVVGGAVNGAVAGCDGPGRSGALEGKGNEDGCCRGEELVGRERVGCRVEDEGDGLIAAGGGCFGVGDFLRVQEGDEEGGCPACAEDEDFDRSRGLDEGHC